MQNLTQQQLRESIYNFHHNDPFDHILLDERDVEGNITTVVRYDEETILVQHIDSKTDDGVKYKIYPNESFLKALDS